MTTGADFDSGGILGSNRLCCALFYVLHGDTFVVVQPLFSCVYENESVGIQESFPSVAKSAAVIISVASAIGKLCAEVHFHVAPADVDVYGSVCTDVSPLSLSPCHLALC